MVEDTGETPDWLLKQYAVPKAGERQTDIRLDICSRLTMDVPLDYVGFVISDKFIVSCGVNCGEQYRDLRYVAAIKTPEYDTKSALPDDSPSFFH